MTFFLLSTIKMMFWKMSLFVHTNETQRCPRSFWIDFYRMDKNILQNIFLCFEKKVSHTGLKRHKCKQTAFCNTGLERHDGEYFFYFWVSFYNAVIIVLHITNLEVVDVALCPHDHFTGWNGLTTCTTSPRVPKQPGEHRKHKWSRINT